MAIKWGSYQNNSTGNGMRLGYEFTQSPSSVGTGTSSVTVTLKVYVQTKAAVYDSSNSYSITGNFSASGSVNISHGSGGGTTLIRTLSRTVSTSYSGTVRSSFSASLSGIAPISGTASVSGSWTTAQRPISAPYAPDNISASRTSDTSHTIRWAKDPGTSAANPYQNIEVQRWDNVGNSWGTIATLSGSATSYTNTSTRANRQYRWRVRAKNSAGASGWVYTGYWSTTPTPPNKPTASKSANDITLHWTNTATKGSGVEVWHAADGVWETSRLVLLSGNPTSWTHTNPDPTKTHTYKLKAQAGATDDAPNLYSGFSAESNVIQLLTNPTAPTRLSPASGVMDAQKNDVVLTWQHNEVDGTAQTGYDLRYRIDGGEWETLTDRASTASRRTFPAGTLPNGSTMDWQVRTYGQYNIDPAYSPWSAAATLTLSATPEAGVIFPDAEIPVDTSRISAEWSFYDEEGTSQAQYKVKLYSAGGESLLETKTGVGDATSVALSTLLKDGGAYRLGVSVQDGAGLWSEETLQDFTVSYALPNVPMLSALWDEARAAVVVSIDNPADGAAADVHHNELWRSVDWETYYLVDDNIPPNGTVTDYIPALGMENVYRVVAVTEIEAAAQSEPVIFEPPVEGGWFIVNGGDAFDERVRVRYNPSLSRNSSRERAVRHFAGRRYPVETAGEHRNRTFDLSVSVLGDDDAALDALEEIADLPAPLVLRTPFKDRMFASLEGVSSTRANGYENVSLKFTQIDTPAIASMPLDPVVYRTNWAAVPIADSSAFANYSATTTGESSVEWLTGQSDGPVGPVTAYGRATTVIAPSTGSGGWMTYNEAAKRAPLTGEAGEKVTVSLYVRYTGDLAEVKRTLRIYLYNGGSAVQSENFTFSRPSGEWVRISGTVTAIDAFDSVGWWDYFTGGDPAPAGSTFDVAGLLISRGDQVLDYFDGDNYEGDAILTARWSGERNNSPSHLTRGGSTA